MTTDGGGFTLIAKLAPMMHPIIGPMMRLSISTVQPWGIRQRSRLRMPNHRHILKPRECHDFELSGSAYAIHTFSTEERNWGGYLNEIWNECGYAISTKPMSSSTMVLDSVLGNALYFRHFDGYVPNCSSEERAMFSEVVSNAGYIGSRNRTNRR